MKKKILVVFPQGNISKQETGKEVKIHHLTKELRKLGNEIITVEPREFMFEENPISENRYFFNNFSSKILDLNPDYLRKLNEAVKSEDPHILHISYHKGFLSSKLCTSLNRHRAKLVYDSHNVDSELAKQSYQRNGGVRKILYYLYDKNIERLDCKLADKILSVSERDKNLFKKIYSIKPSKLTVIPSGSATLHTKRIKKEKCKAKLGFEKNKFLILFHGSFSYPPNKEAIRLIKDYISPNLSKYSEDFSIAIAGKGVPKLKKGNCKFLGFVEDLREIIYAADIAICPILRGGGTRLKILDYIGAGLPVVTTEKGIEGIEAENGRDALITKGVDERFIKKIKALMESEKKRKEIGNNAKRLAEKKYDWKLIGKKLNHLYENLL